jgi:predicted metal-dependent peptidase
MAEKKQKMATDGTLVPMDKVTTDVDTPKNSGEKIRHTSQILYKKGEHKKFTDLIVMMLSSNTLPYYAEFSTFINYYESTNIPTCGVNITKEGMNFYWNRDFVDSLTEQEAMFLLLHEDFHLLFDHTKRSIFYNKEFANIAQDMIINQIIHDDIIKKFKNEGGSRKDIIDIPKSHDEYILDKDKNPITGPDGKKVKNPMYGKNTALFIPKEYKGEPIFENLYEWLKEQHDDYKQRKEQQQQQQQGQGNQDQNQGGGQQPDPNGQQGQGQGQPDPNGQQGQGQGQSESGQGQPDPNGQGGNGSGDPNQGQPDPNGQGGNGDGDGQDQGGDGQGDNEPKDSFGKPTYGKNGQNGVECNSLDSIFDGMENGDQMTLDSHIEDDVQEQSRKSIVNDFMQRLKNRGLVSGDVEAILNKLRKSKKDYLKEIKRTISNHIIGSSKKKSITRPNRRGIEGIKGKKKYKNIINVILDTSGSMCGDFEKVLSYVFQNDIHLNLIQIDTKVNAVESIKNKRELQKVMIKGMGGTVLQPAIDYISEPENRMSTFNNLILTDGYTDTLNFTNIKGKSLILTTGTKPKIEDPKCAVKCIEIDLENSLHSS